MKLLNRVIRRHGPTFHRLRVRSCSYLHLEIESTETTKKMSVALSTPETRNLIRTLQEAIGDEP